jgi:hypothetical protein
MHPRKSDKLVSAISNWIEDIEKIKDNFKRKSKNILQYANKITNLNNPNRDEKIFLMSGLEDSKFVLENNTIDRLDFILEEILGDEIEENENIKKMLKILKDFEESFEEVYLSLKNFMKAFNVANNNMEDSREILSNFAKEVEVKTDKYENNFDKMNELFPIILDFLREQQKLTKKFDII